jgi:hypothetical protein
VVHNRRPDQFYRTLNERIENLDSSVPSNAVQDEGRVVLPFRPRGTLLQVRTRSVHGAALTRPASLDSTSDGAPDGPDLRTRPSNIWQTISRLRVAPSARDERS